VVRVKLRVTSGAWAWSNLRAVNTVCDLFVDMFVVLCVPVVSI
jgi:hypothetical protein